MNPQSERNTPLRIKFASKDENGNLIPDAHDEYHDLFPAPVTPLGERWIATLSEIQPRPGGAPINMNTLS